MCASVVFLRFSDSTIKKMFQMTETNDQTMVQQIKPRPIYSDMPHHIKKNIIKFADPFKK